ncbi:DUF475 domain-containing protein [Thauera butanivorans]|uniref:DUF475 domain-containing protein n=1 Tax=Thauera butanivorans TaxID=86174 RepID=UPI000839A88A|nr:DUF475 domain-containing protein [Thauera butanivorans]
MQDLGYFKWSFIVTILGIVGGYLLAGWSGAFIVIVLAILETSLSFDNAVVNATVLKHMDEKWRRRFLLWGILIAVFGMRIVFPLAIVGIVAHMGPVEVIRLALFDEAEYARILLSAHHEIAAFGGAFLSMVFLKFFVDSNKDLHWLSVVEAPLTKLGRLEAAQILLALLAILGSAAWLDNDTKRVEFVVAGIWGLITYIVADGLGAILGGEEGEGGKVAAKTGFAGFMYLELLDASFSFDGVIGAFALTTSLPIIAIGLGVGAMFVRSFTLMLVYRETLNAYRFLEHGAFWAIGALAAVMFIGVHVHIPEVITGLVGAVLIGAAFLSSLRGRRAAA